MIDRPAAPPARAPDRAPARADVWWDAARHADRRPKLLARNRIKQALRTYFERHGFTEVECAALAISPGNETHLHA
ncbi:hypothetical protein J8J27_33540, partial [Mycobacterium tuberculosis]|nr:hypothetical protein [Mycobacterium tuberculosis]